MSTWTIGPLEVSSGGESSDDSTEESLRAGVEYYSFGPPPGPWPVDPDNDWTIHQWALQTARMRGEVLKTDYKPNDADMPKNLRAYLEACSKSKAPSGTVF